MKTPPDMSHWKVTLLWVPIKWAPWAIGLSHNSWFHMSLYYGTLRPNQVDDEDNNALRFGHSEVSTELKGSLRSDQ